MFENDVVPADSSLCTTNNHPVNVFPIVKSEEVNRSSTFAYASNRSPNAMVVSNFNALSYLVCVCIGRTKSGFNPFPSKISTMSTNIGSVLLNIRIRSHGVMKENVCWFVSCTTFPLKNIATFDGSTFTTKSYTSYPVVFRFPDRLTDTDSPPISAAFPNDKVGSFQATYHLSASFDDALLPTTFHSTDSLGAFTRTVNVAC